MSLHSAKNYPHIIGLIEAALVEGETAPWMYDVLAISMKQANRPEAEIERVLLSRPDVLPTTYDNAIIAAGYLEMFQSNARALHFYRQASQLDPTAVLPYNLGLKLAMELNDPAGMEWAACGTLRWIWTPDYAQRHREAEGLSDDLVKKLRQKKRDSEAEHLLAAVAAARQRDLVLDLAWNGEADLDLIVEEPQGTVCSHHQPRTSGGGVMVHDGFGPDQKNTYEQYICPEGFPGQYRIRIRHTGGNLVGKRAILKVTRYAGTKQEIVETLVVPIGKEDKVLRTTLAQGRLKEPVRMLIPERPQALKLAPAVPVIQQVGGTEASNRELSRLIRSQQQFPIGPGRPVGAVGYQPVISIIPEGTSLSARALVSPDRRYVRISVSPTFTALTDVFTFGIVNSGNGAAGGGGRP
jgi:hypothetical protein